MFVVVDGGRRVRIFLEIMADASEESDTSTDVDIEEDEEEEIHEYFSSDHLFPCTFCLYSHKPGIWHNCDRDRK